MLADFKVVEWCDNVIVPTIKTISGLECKQFWSPGCPIKPGETGGMSCAMEYPKSFIFLVGLLLVISLSSLEKVDGAGACGKSSPDSQALKLIPCATAASDKNAAVSSSCCLQVKKIIQNPSCLCAVVLSNMAKFSGVDTEIAITIPERCNIADRPVGFKCGGEFATPLRLCSPESPHMFLLLFRRFPPNLLLVLQLIRFLDGIHVQLKTHDSTMVLVS